MKILVTGNQGFVGSALSQLLGDERPQYFSVGLDTGFFSPQDPLKRGKESESVTTQVIGDIRDVDASILNGIDAVVHLAAISNDPMGDLDERVTLDVNLSGTKRIATLAKNAGVKNFVFASSCSVYGQSGDAFKSEIDSVDPLTTYAKSKVLAEEALAAMASPSFSITCLRFATAAGWSANFRSDLAVNDITLGALREKQIVLRSDGQSWRPIIDVSDMARAILWFLENESRDEPFLVVNIGSEEGTYTILEIAEEVAALIPGTKIQFANNAGGDDRSYRVSFQRMKEVSDFRPQVVLQQTVMELSNRWKSISGSSKSGYVRLLTLTELLKQRAIDNELRWTKSV